MAESRNQVALYAAVGPELTHYAVDREGAARERRGTVPAPANIHYAWPHASSRYLYIASSDSASGVGGFTGTRHHVTAWHIDRETGALSPHGEGVALPTRPIHMTLDIPSEHILVAFSKSERAAGLSHQPRHDAGHAGHAARADRPRHLWAPGAGQSRQQEGHPRDPRP